MAQTNRLLPPQRADAFPPAGWGQKLIGLAPTFASLRAGEPLTIIDQKRAHVRAATQARDHRCHWPGCNARVPPAAWGCRPHWFTLPKPIRDQIWAAYRIGQETTTSPSRDYLNAALAAQAWIAENYAGIDSQLALRV